MASNDISLGLELEDNYPRSFVMTGSEFLALVEASYRKYSALSRRAQLEGVKADVKQALTARLRRDLREREAGGAGGPAELFS